MTERLLEATPARQRPTARGLAGLLVFAGSIVLSAGLLFIVEPMFAKMLLPRFGGSASVWSVAIVFFQGALLAGYLYADLLIRHLPGRAGKALHLCLLAGAGAFLPLGVAPGWGAPPADGESWYLLTLFAVSIGAPFVVLSANAPLLQAWFTRSNLPGHANPYPLYAASNIGSLGALLAYPFLVEPLASLKTQAATWTVGYAALCAIIGVAALVSGARPDSAGVREGAGRIEPISGRTYAWWIFLSMVPSAGLVAVSAHISTDVAAAPFLWVLPLALYLATFILAFGRQSTDWQRTLLAVLPLVLAGLVLVLALELRTASAFDLLLHLSGFFIVSLALHGRLAASRPAPARLTTFYLAMSIGGVIGGILAALAAPRVFSWVAEYPLVLVLAAFALPKRAVLTAGALAAILLAARLFPLDVRDRETRRSFYGVHTMEVTRDGQYRTLRHGAEIHGAQHIADAKGAPITGKPEPLTYYSEDSPISEAIDAARTRKGGGALDIGVVGLGTGSIACLAEPADRLDFFEIDPEVIALAHDPAKFRFLSACMPNAGMVMGDARQTLPLQERRYDVLILDAFSSDAIPTHLLTVEAMQIYRDRLAAGGMLVLHISNNHLRLNEVVAATARAAGLVVRLYDEDEPEYPLRFVYEPTVLVAARAQADFGPLATQPDWTEPPVLPRPKPWTDDFSNLLGAFVAKVFRD